MSPVPAAAFFPPAFTNSVPDWIWRPKDIDKGKSIRLYVCSQSDFGWRYYTESKEIRLSREFPTDYESDIGYRYGHGPGKIDKEGNPASDRDKPVRTCLFRVWHVENQRMMAAVIDSYPLLQALQQIFENPEFLFNDTEGFVSNFYLQMFHNASPATSALTYTAQGHLRPSNNPAMFAAAAQPWYPDQYWLGLNPFDAPATPPENAGQPGTRPEAAPPQRTVLQVLRDPNGADLEMGPNTTEEVVW